MTRRRSLDKEKPDCNQLRFHRDRNLGHTVSTEFYQQIPFFFTREGCQINNIGHYRGSSAFMICNGPSLVSGRYDLSLLKRPGVITYGVNNGPRTLRPNFWTCVDDPKRFLKSIWMDPCITKFVPHAHAEKHIFDNEKWEDSPIVVGQCPNVYYFHRNNKFVADRFLFEDTINWGNSGDNGGGRSVMLPVIKILFLLGFRKVYLLGADFKMSETYTYHFDEQRHKGAVNCNMNTYDRLKSEYLPSLQPYFEAEGFNIYNCNPESELKCFPMVSFEDAIAEATSGLGDVDNERTWGMYSKPEERQKWKEEPSDTHKAHLANIINRPNAPVSFDGKIIPTHPVSDQGAKPSQPLQPSQPERILNNNRMPQDEDDFVVENNDNKENNDMEDDRVVQPIPPPIPQPAPQIRAPIIPMAPKLNKPMSPVPSPILRTPVTRQVGQVRPMPTNIEVDTKRVISKIPCGGMADASSRFPKPNIPRPIRPEQHITIVDDGH